jgi:Ca2+-transporting ATPase
VLVERRAKVRWDGNVEVISSEEIVPGDVVLLESGDVVPADLQLAECFNLQCDESALTGESVPVAKSIDVVQQDAPLAERTNMAFKGTAITRGAGAGVVVATGRQPNSVTLPPWPRVPKPSPRHWRSASIDWPAKLVWATLA